MEINITTFTNPHLFWFFEKRNIKKRESIENELKSKKLPSTANVLVGEVVAVYDGRWKRAVVKSTEAPYTCWLLDYGIEHRAKVLYKIPIETASKTPLIKQAALIDTICLQQVYSVSGITNIEREDFTVGCIKRTQDYLESAYKLFFSCTREINDVHLGTITVVTLESTFDLTEILTNEKVLIQNKDLFQSAFANNSKVDIQLNSSKCLSPLKKFEFSDDDFTTNGIGRGVSRVSPQDVYKRRQTKKAALEEWVQQSKLSANKEKSDSDEDFSDAICEDSSSSASQHLNNSQTSLKDSKQEYADVDTSSKDSEPNDQVLKEHNNAFKKSNQVNWNELRSASSNKVSHLNIPPSGMLLKKQQHKTSKSKDRKKRLSSFTSKGVGRKTSSTSDSVENDKDTFLGVRHLSSSASKEVERNKFNTTSSTTESVKNEKEAFVGGKHLSSSTSNEAGCNERNTASSISENVKSQQETVDVPKMQVVGCHCEQCVGWKGDDLYFNENKKHFQDTKCSKKCKNAVKPMLLLKEKDVGNIKIRSCVIELKTKIKRSSAPTVLVHGSTLLSPVTSLSAVPFHADIHKALRKFEHVYSVQSYVWPALMRHMNICIIGNRNSGKTMAYLPGICSFEVERKERYPDLPQNTISPLTVILCAGVQTAEKVFNTILKLLEHAVCKTYVALAVQPIDKKCLNQFQKHAHILVATPKTLTSLITTRIITLKRLCHFILEDADVVLERFPSEIDSLLKLIQSMLMHRSCNYTVQMIMTAEHWTLPIESLLKSLVVVPVVCIGSYLEAALYGRVDLQMHFVDSKMKMTTLSNFLKGKSDVCRTVVICNTNEEIVAVKEFLLFAGVNCLFITDDMEYKDILETEARWLHSLAGKHLALICTESVFSHSINITNAVLLVHYSLPDTWTQFTDRFRCLIDNYTSPLTTNVSDDWTRCKVHIFVDESCTKQFLRIVQVMERLGAKLPNNFQAYFQEIISNYEKTKISAKIKICNNLRLFGKCTSANCRNRHFLSKDLDCINNLPKNGIIRFKIALVRDVTCFGIQLLEHTDADGNITKYDLNSTLETQLKEAMEKEKLSVFDAKPGSRYVYHSVNDQRYYRCTVRKIVSTEKITKKASEVSIRCLDTGRELDVSCSCLYELPLPLAKIDPQVNDAFLANMLPPDSDVAWSFYCKTRVEKILQDADYDKEEAYATGQIQLQLGTILWLKNIMVYEVLKSTNLTVNKLNLRKRLLDENLAIPSDAQLEGLYKSCADANIELPDYNLPVKDPEISVIKQTKPQWSYFDESEAIEVYIACVETPSLFYLRLKKFYDLFLNLQKEIQANIAKPFYPPVTDVSLDRCYLAKDPEGDEYARVIVKEIVGDFIKVFFVDYGDYATIDKAELKYLPDEFITKLPFQVIECRLYGIEPINDQWDLSAIRSFFDFMFEPNTDYFRTLYTTSSKQEPSDVTGGLKYSVLLVDNFKDNLVIINKLFIDSGAAIPIKDEDINVEFSLPSQVVEEQIDVISDIDDKEMTLDEINKLQKEHGPKVEVIEAESVDNEPTWEIHINDAEVFIKKFISREVDAPSTSTRTDWDLPPLQALPPSSHSTPNIFWYQTNTDIRINIMLPNIEHCDMRIVRGKHLFFSTTYNEKLYKLNLSFFDNVEKNFQYTLGGPHIKVSLKKKATAEWPRLVVSTQKMRFIKYDFARCDGDEEKKRRFLDLGLEDDEEDVGVMHYIGSDDNYSESDFESDFED